MDTSFFETFKRANVTLVNLGSEPINGPVCGACGRPGPTYELDILIFATGFDAVTGTLLRIDIVGRAGDLGENGQTGRRTTWDSWWRVSPTCS